MVKITSIKSNHHFSAVNNLGSKFIGRFMICISCRNCLIGIEPAKIFCAHVGIKAAKKIGIAATRNKIRRRIKAVIRHTPDLYNNLIKEGVSFVIVVRKHAVGASFQQFYFEWVKIIRYIYSKKE